MTTHEIAAATPKQLITAVVKLQGELAAIETEARTLGVRRTAKSALVGPLLANLRGRFGITQAELYSAHLTRSMVAKLEAGKEEWSNQTVEDYLSALNTIITDRAAAFQAITTP